MRIERQLEMLEQYHRRFGQLVEERDGLRGQNKGTEVR